MTLSIHDDYARRRKLHTVGVWLFLAALGMLFASSMLAYVIIRLQQGTLAGAGSVHLPGLLWVSTLVILTSSATMHGALSAVRLERQHRFRSLIVATLVLALLFVIVQVPAMAALLRAHYANQAQNLHVYGLVFFLILLHALHVVGGVAGLVRVAIYAHLGRYDHESHAPVRHIAMYWHFLDIVWIVMFTILLIAP